MAKIGRGRIYHISGKYQSLNQFGATLEYIEELRLRLRDLIDDIPPELGNRAPEWSANSIFFLSAHMVWAEQNWIERAVNGHYSIQTVLEPTPSPEIEIDKEHLLLALDEVGKKITFVYLEHVEHGSCSFTQTGPFQELTELLQHISWHYSYHSGQVGLLRRYIGLSYKWSFA
jgi:uncharacterized damage-inducible protein DinB